MVIAVWIIILRREELKMKLYGYFALFLSISFGVGCSSSTTDSCASGCKIGNTCYPNNVRNPDDPCKKCDTSASTTAWTDDAAHCNTNTCDNGCLIDAVCYPNNVRNGANLCELCDTNRSTTDWSQDTQSCDGSLLPCPSGCLIDAVCYPNNVKNPADLCEKCDTSASTTAWSDDSANCNTNTCDNGCLIGSVCFPDHVRNPSNLCQLCDRATANDAWTADTQNCDGDLRPCATGCLIDTVCYPHNVINPNDVCKKCDTAQATNAWTNNQGGACDDGDFCTLNDACDASGVCAGTARDCSDHIACNGAETCSGGACQAGTTTCTGTQYCDAISGLCKEATPCPGCLIGGTCYGENQNNPSNECQECKTAQATDAWTPRTGQACDDGSYCGTDDKCNASGVCASTTTRNCSDALFCTAQDTCNEAADTCVNTGNPCTTNQVCLEADDRCCTPNVPDEYTCVGNTQIVSDDCGTELSRVNCEDNNATCNQGQCVCNEGFTGEFCDRCLIFVDAGRTDDTGAGTTWSTAKKTLQVGLDQAYAEVTDTNNDIEHCEVWVKKGTYKPTVHDPACGTSCTTRHFTFLLKSNVAVYGGFAGTETSRAQRNVAAANQTTLSGDLGAAGDNSDNSYHVLKGTSQSVLDGFIIKGGNADASGALDSFKNGGGMYNNGYTDVVIANCVFTENSARVFGGGMAILGSNLNVSNCKFINNVVTEGYGGALYVSLDPTTSFRLSNSLFINNEATDGSGGAVGTYNLTPNSRLTNCTFTGNTAGNDGSVMNNSNSTPTIANCIFWGNPGTGTDINDAGGSALPVVTTIVEGGYGTAAITADPKLTPEGKLQDTSTAAIDEGTNAFIAKDRADLDQDENRAERTPFDLDGKARINNSTVDIGAYEHQ
jgi:hypothetical protein